MSNKYLNLVWKFCLKLWAEGDKLWAEGIIEAYGNIKLEWKWIDEKEAYACHLENGEVYNP